MGNSINSSGSGSVGSSSSGSGSMGSSSSGSCGSGCFGQQWKGHLNIYPDIGNSKGKMYYVSHNSIKGFNYNHVQIHDEDSIIEAIHYSSSLSFLGCELCCCKHDFIVFKTESKWWSIEKHDDYLTLQSNDQLDMLTKIFIHSKRSPASQIQKEKSDKKVKLLFDWLIETNQLHTSYNICSTNCTHFAEDVFNFLTAT